MRQTAATGLSVSFSIGLIFSRSAHFVRYKTKQKSLPRDTFSGLKIAAKYVCGRCSAPDPVGGAYSAPPAPLAVLGEGRTMGRDGSKGEDRKGEKRGQGRAEYRRGGEGTGGKEKGREDGRNAPPLLGQVYAPADEQVVTQT